MKNLIQNIFEKNFDSANQIAEEKITEIFEQKLVEMKKIIMAKEQRQAWTEMPGGSEARREKLYRGVIEEDDLDEMDLSREKPSTDIEDRRTSVVQNQNKTSLPGTQNTSDEGKDDLKTTVIQKNMNEEEGLDEARIKIVKARIRGGKIQRRKKVSNVSGMTFRGGKLTRMSPAERRRRKMGQRRGKMKRKAKMTRTLMKRRRSLQKRRTLGLG
jgi:hypothetical protein